MAEVLSALGRLDHDGLRAAERRERAGRSRPPILRRIVSLRSQLPVVLAVRRPPTLFDAILNTLPPLVLHDESGNMTYVNEAARVLFGWPYRDYGLGCPVGELFSGEDRWSLGAAYPRRDLTLVTPSGERVPVHTATQGRIVGGRPVRLTVFERQDGRPSEERLRAGVDSAAMMLLAAGLIDPD